MVIFSVLLTALLIWSVVKGIVKKRFYQRLIASEKLKVCYGLMVNYLKLMKFEKFDYETPREYAKRIDEEGCVHSEANLETLIESYENVQYGLYASTDVEVLLYKSYLKDVKKEALQNAGLLRCLKTMVSEFLMT